MTPEQNKKLVEDMAIIVFGKFVIEEDFINLQAALDVAKAAIRDNVLEEAAVEADHRFRIWGQGNALTPVVCDATACAEIALAIRAMKGQSYD